jgi:hypothetical protein
MSTNSFNHDRDDSAPDTPTTGSSADSRRLAARSRPMCHPSDAKPGYDRTSPADDSRITGELTDDANLKLTTGKNNDRSQLISSDWVHLQP